MLEVLGCDSMQIGKSDKAVPSNFFRSAEYISMLQI